MSFHGLGRRGAVGEGPCNAFGIVGDEARHAHEGELERQRRIVDGPGRDEDAGPLEADKVTAEDELLARVVPLGAGLAAGLDRIPGALVLDQQGPGDAGRRLGRAHKVAGRKGGDEDRILHPRIADGAEGVLDDGGVVGKLCVVLDLHVDADAKTLCQFERLFQRRHLQAPVAGCLSRVKPSRGERAEGILFQEPAAGIEGAHFGKAALARGKAPVPEGRAGIGGARKAVVVQDHEPPVAGACNVQFDEVGTGAGRQLKGRQGVLRRHGAEAPVGAEENTGRTGAEVHGEPSFVLLWQHMPRGRKIKANWRGRSAMPCAENALSFPGVPCPTGKIPASGAVARPAGRACCRHS